MSDVNTDSIDPSFLDEISEVSPEENELSLEQLALLISTNRIRILEDKVQDEYKVLKQRQEEVRVLNKLLKLLNRMTDAEGELDIKDDAEVREFLEKAVELGSEIDLDKTKYNSHERELLIENLRTTVDDKNTENDLQLQVITRLTNERYETYQMVRSILKPLHEDKINKARAVSGR